MNYKTVQDLIGIVERIEGAMNHGTWCDEKGMRLKDTPEWVARHLFGSSYNNKTDRKFY